MPTAILAQPEGPEEIVVTADFREQAAADVPVSVSVIGAEELDARTVQHVEEIIVQVPNLNYSGEGSRARYFQLRGVGELEGYDGAPNPSVGFIIDDIDFSGIGSIGTLFDVDRVEVLRGPQGTRYGANALAGLIYMRSAAPTEELSADFEATVGNDDTRAIGAAVGGPLGDALGYRFSVHRYESNGFRDNVFLGRDDTYGRDETTVRGKLRWDAGERVGVDFTALYVDVDNGYDAWTIDNDFTTESDRPGRDAQRSAAVSARVEAELDRFDVVSITGLADTDAVFSFDGDWGNPAFWEPFVYDFVAVNDRERKTVNQEIRLQSKDGALAGGRGRWLAGVYALDLEESNDRLNAGVYDDDAFCDPCVTDAPVVSDYDATNLAVFGQLDFALGARAELTAGVRWERRTADYVDTVGNRFDPTDDMVGGELAVTWRLDERWATYVRAARGYKAGGFNTDLAGVDFDAVDGVSRDQIEFGPEYMTSLEGGVKGRWLDGRVTADVSAFFTRREDQQIKVPLQLVLGDPLSFLLLTDNAERARHRGLEATLDWRPTERLAVSTALGLLDTEIEEFGVFPTLEGREQAHAPGYTYAVGVEYRPGGRWWGRVDFVGADAFLFDYGHDQRSEPYTTVNLRIGRDWGDWSLDLWARNVLDEEYAVRGFFFGNEPPDFPNALYVRLGDPRHYGVTLRYRF
ncbi:MAG TPA: TonB-dependent receptor [Gammaproteobacteria bacterium]